MLPTNTSYSYDTEIDIVEILGNDPRTIFMTYHYNAGGVAQSADIRDASGAVMGKMTYAYNGNGQLVTATATAAAQLRGVQDRSGCVNSRVVVTVAGTPIPPTGAERGGRPRR